MTISNEKKKLPPSRLPPRTPISVLGQNSDPEQIQEPDLGRPQAQKKHIRKPRTVELHYHYDFDLPNTIGI